MKRVREEEVILISKEGLEFCITLENARKSKTITNHIEEYGMVPIELKYITHKTLNLIFNCRLTDDLIPQILACNYLDMQEHLKWCFSSLKIPERFKNDGFLDNERQFINSRKAHLTDIHVELMHTDTNTVLDIPKNLFEVYYFEKPIYNNYTDWFERMLEFRKRHVYFWHVTTNYIIRDLRQTYKVDLNEDQLFDIAEYYARDSFVLPNLCNYALKRHEIPNIDKIKHMERLFVAVKKHGSIANMLSAVEKIQLSKIRIREAREIKRNNESENREKIRSYIRELGFINFNVPDISYPIKDVKKDPKVLELVESLEKDTETCNLNHLITRVTRQKAKEILMKIDAKEEKKRDAIYEYFKDNGFRVSKRWINIQVNKERMLKTLKDTRDRLLEMGYVVEEDSMFAYNFNIDSIVEAIQKDIRNIRDHSTSWDSFLQNL